MGAVTYFACVLMVLYTTTSIYRVTYFVSAILIVIAVPSMFLRAFSPAARGWAPPSGQAGRGRAPPSQAGRGQGSRTTPPGEGREAIGDDGKESEVKPNQQNVVGAKAKSE